MGKSAGVVVGDGVGDDTVVDSEGGGCIGWDDNDGSGPDTNGIDGAS